jgi:steroid delta-isomerase-like uncharacterized protein
VIAPPLRGKLSACSSSPCMLMSSSRTISTMTSENVTTAIAFLRAAHRGDLKETARLIGDGYVWTDHIVGLTAHTEDALRKATEDFAAWSDWELQIDKVMETTDGTVIAQFVATGTHAGTWLGIPPTGKRAVFSICDFIRFDSQGQIISEEAYGDRLSIMEQLGLFKPQLHS